MKKALARRSVALRACLIAAAVLAGSAPIGDWLLRTHCRSPCPPSASPAACFLVFTLAALAVQYMIDGVRAALAG